MTKREQIKDYKLQKARHVTFLTIFISWTMLIVACSYALFDKTFNQWVSTSGAFFLPFLISVDGIWYLLFEKFKMKDLKGLKKYLNEVETANRIRKKDFDKVSNDVEVAIVNQGEFEKDCQDKIEAEKTKKILDIYKEIENGK